MGHKSSSDFIVGIQTWKGLEDGPGNASRGSEDLKAALMVKDELDHNLSSSELFDLQYLQFKELDILQESHRDILDVSQQPILVFSYPEITLNIVTGTHYPRQPPTWEIENRKLSRRTVDTLRIALREYLALRIDNALVEVEDRKYLLGLVKITDNYLSIYRTKLLATLTTAGDVNRTTTSKKSANIEEFANSAYPLLGKTLPQIISKLGPEIRILHVETVLRSNLRAKFHSKRDELRKKFEGMSVQKLFACIPKGHKARGRKADMIEELTRPRVTFHGTDASSVPNIVRCGFLLPGGRDPTTGTEHEVRCGSTYGRGIYTSPDPIFSHGYTNGEKTNWSKKSVGGRKMIVCAQLMGRSVVVGSEQRGNTTAIMDADSHVASNQLEYVVFDPAMVLPCYVIHYEEVDEDHENDSKDDSAWTSNSNANRLSNKFGPTLAPGDAQRQKSEIFARGSKWFPYGYGPATNGRFVIEDVAEIDDDEEEWGNYQGDRAAEGDDGLGPWCNLVGMNNNDQYAAQRVEKLKTGVKFRKHDQS